MCVLTNMVKLSCAACLLVLVVQARAQFNNTTSAVPVSSAATPAVSSFFKQKTFPTPTTDQEMNSSCQPCPAVGLVSGGVAVGSFITGAVVGLLGVCIPLLCVKRPCFIRKDIQSSDQTQRFIRSESASKQEMHGVRGEHDFLPTYHLKQEGQESLLDASGGDEVSGSEGEREEEDKKSIRKGPLPPTPAPLTAPPPPPPLSSVHPPPVQPKPPTRQYDIPHVRSAAKVSDTPLEEYDFPDVNIPLGLTSNLSKSQTLVSIPSFSGRDRKKRGPIKKPLGASLSVDNLPGATEEALTEHYYVMDPSPQQPSTAGGIKTR